MSDDPTVNGPRRRGRPPRIDRERVVSAAVEVARDVGLDGVQMSAVAERLGVRPSALNYHVADRQELLEAAATEMADLRFADGWQPSRRADWRTWIRAWASAFRTMLLAQPHLAPYIKLTPDMAPSLEETDEFLGVLHRAGFAPETVANGTTFLSQTVFMNVQDQLLARTAGRHPQVLQLAQLFAETPPHALPNLRAYIDSEIHADPDQLFTFAVDCVIAGLEAHLHTATKPWR